MAKTIAYLRVSTSQQDLKNQKFEILDYAQKNGLSIDDFVEVEISSRKSVEERKIDYLVSMLSQGDRVIVSELSRIGRSTVEVLNIINELASKKVFLIAIKQNLNINGSENLQAKVMVTMFSLFAELERDLISDRTKRALEARKAAGVKLGRPKGATGVSKLDGMEGQITELLRKQVSLSSIAKIFSVSRGTVYSFIATRGLTA
ncbi:Resolvase domain protein [Geobacter metallireducens RCH3]|uniref:Resolvase-like serine recombinase n=1 Tax=Geobacter metallireducens (strain ATCC 53774 / DSM 7210 / GS-15) TaxID=269799 RepID=Q39QW9_GEOMG|nr:recombinase family protein [Geobacter metallireducens]ABB33355.1 resolvase-like serine recombinase [Geobacter metallireducens GS-15]EHP85419.1 Resolvase domain protein [Geobacter metallireducens RCH3]